MTASSECRRVSSRQIVFGGMQSFALNPLWPAGHLPHKGGDDKRLDLHVSQTMPSADRITGGQRGGR
ncbi:hypothetical protein, partial [Sinorhizobium meliloti]|uniref:hypothetical protein n=1 Tax=Rhizobium meliloti TaxID=382 RepID=UPI001AECCE2D